MPEPLLPRPADDEAASTIRGLYALDRHFFDKVPLSAEEIAEIPELAEEYARMQRLAASYRDALLPLLGSDDAPQPIVYEGRVFSRAAGRVVVIDAAGSPAARRE